MYVYQVFMQKKLFLFIILFSQLSIAQINFEYKGDSVRNIFTEANEYEIKARIYQGLWQDIEFTNFKKAIEYGEKSLENARLSENEALKMGVTTSLAFSFMRMGYNTRSLKLSRELLTNKVVIKNNDFPIVYAVMAMNYAVQQDFVNTLKYQKLANYFFEKDLEKSLKNDQRGYYAGPAKLAEAYDNNNILDSAYYYAKMGYERLFKVKMEAWSFDFRWENRLIFGKILEKMNREKEALKMYDDAIKFAYELKNQDGIQQIQLAKAKYYNKRNKADSSLKYANLAYLGSQQNANIQITAESALLLKKIFTGKNQFEKALFFNEKANIAKDSLINEKKTKEIVNLEFEEIQKYKQIEAEILALKNQNRFIGVGVVASFLSILTFIFYRNKLKTDQLNEKLNLQNTEIESFNKELEQKVEQRTSELQNALDEVKSAFGKGQSTERKRVSADLHDEIGSALSTIAIFSDISKRKAEKSAPELVAEIDKIGIKSRQMIQTIKDTIWSLNEDNNTGLLEKMFLHAGEVLRPKEIKYDWQVADNQLFAKISLNQKRNIFLAFKEALNNIVKHAEATKVIFSCKNINNEIEISITDNGKGFDTIKAKNIGNGLTNFKDRMAEIGGEFYIDSKLGIGTNLKFTIRNA